MRFVGGSWDPATISALAAIFGSLTGALASSVSTWITQSHQGRRDILAKRISYCEQLYSDFISESARVNVNPAPVIAASLLDSVLTARPGCRWVFAEELN
jgi:hypothetical protein